MADIKSRYHILDSLRGFLVIGMVFYHFLFNLRFMFRVNWSFGIYDATSWIQPIGASLFIILCGVSCTFSQNNFRRGLKILIAAGAVTIVTAMPFLDVDIIWFGILHFLAVGVLWFAVLEKLLKKVPTIVGIIGCLILFFATFYLRSGYLGFSPTASLNILWIPPLPVAIISGINPRGFWSPDYFPTLPWIFMLMLGTFLGRWVPLFKDVLQKNPAPWLGAIGRKALLIYLLHAPVVFFLAYFISKI